MCGFVGNIEHSKRLNIDYCKRALNSLIHRGRDNTSYQFLEKNVFLGHQRLSIIDISNNANQPFQSVDGMVSIVFNGEIYNYSSLQKQLYGNFITNSDTEVLLNGFIQEGVKFFKKLRGIYSFGIIDRRKSLKVILARDPAGVKPLYYSANNNRLMFASEIKALKHLYDKKYKTNETALRQYLNLGFVPEPSTIYRGIRALEPGNFLYWSKKKNEPPKPFYSYNFNILNHNSFNQNTEIVKSKLEIAVKRNLVSDVDISVALSGGIDSSLIYAIGIQNKPSLKATTVSFPNSQNHDEMIESKFYTNNNDGLHDIIDIEGMLNLELMNKLFSHFDQPFADSSAIPVYLISKHISHKSKVIIGGDGGDELFNGYPSQTYLKYFNNISKRNMFLKICLMLNSFFSKDHQRQIKRINNIVIQKGILKKLYEKHSWFPQNTSYGFINAFNESDEFNHIEDYEFLFNEECPRLDTSIIVFDYFRKLMLSDYLRKVDMMSMLNGVEWRVPMLDEDLSSFAFSIPFNQKSNIFNSKKHLREIHKKLYNGRNSYLKKKGFSIPIDKYLSLRDKQKIVNDLEKKDTIVDHYINKKYKKILLKEFINNKNKQYFSAESTYQRVLILYNLQRWEKSI